MFNLKMGWINISPVILSIILGVAILFGMRSLPPRLPLFYSLPWGDEQLATHQEFLLIPAGIIAVTLLNCVISAQLHPSQSFFKRILLFSPLVVSFLLTVTFVKIILNFI